MKVVFIVGPTASGKSELAFQLAKKNHGAIINFDSVQVYEDLLIGSASPSLEEKKQVPHFLFNFVSYPQEITAAEMRNFFFRTLESIQNQFAVVYAVGGSGFYLRAIETGLYSGGQKDVNVAQQVEKECATESGRKSLWQELQSIDPEAAMRISMNDTYRLIRAIEIWRSQGKTPTQLRQELEKNKIPFPYYKIKIGIDMDKGTFKERIRLRTQKMISQGWIEEVEKLLQLGRGNWAPLQSVGYKQVTNYILSGKSVSREQLEEDIALRTMQLVKKQRTWFQRDREITWLQWGSDLVTQAQQLD